MSSPSDTPNPSPPVARDGEERKDGFTEVARAAISERIDQELLSAMASDDVSRFNELVFGSSDPEDVTVEPLTVAQLVELMADMRRRASRPSFAMSPANAAGTIGDVARELGLDVVSSPLVPDEYAIAFRPGWLDMLELEAEALDLERPT